MKGTPVFPVKVMVSLSAMLDTNISSFDEWIATHVSLNDEGDLSIYDGAVLLKEYASGEYDSYTVTEIIPEVEEYKGEGFPL